MFACFVCVVHPSLSDRCFVKLLQIIVWFVFPSSGADFFFFHAPFAGVTKRQQTSSAEEITSFLLDVSHESHAPERQTQ